MQELVEQVAYKLEPYAWSGDVVDLLNEFTIKSYRDTCWRCNTCNSFRGKTDALRKDSVTVVKTQTKIVLVRSGHVDV